MKKGPHKITVSIILGEVNCKFVSLTLQVIIKVY